MLLLLLQKSLLLLAVYFCFVLAESNDVSIELTDETEIKSRLLALLMGASWKDNKQECLEMAAKLMRDSDTNVTIVGTQKVVDAEGNILHVNRIELLVPTLQDEDDNSDEKNSSENEISNESTSEESEVEIRRILEVVYNVSKIEMSVFQKDYDTSSGEMSEIEFHNRHFSYYVGADTYPLYNFTKTTDLLSMKQILKHYEEMKDSSFPPTIIHADVDHTFEQEGSQFPTMNPFISIVETSEKFPPVDILTKAIELFSWIPFKHRGEDIAKPLWENLSKSFPNYKFLVIDPDTSIYLNNGQLTNYYFVLNYYDVDVSDYKVFVMKKE